MNHRNRFILWCWVGSLFARIVGGGSPILEHLYSLEAVDLQVSVPAYEPVLAVSPSELRQEIASRVRSVLAEQSLRVSPGAAVHLLVSVDYNSDAPVAGPGALLVDFELYEPAVLVRPWNSSKQRSLEVVTWKSHRLEVVYGKRLRESLQNGIDAVARELADEVSQAKSYRARVAPPG